MINRSAVIIIPQQPYLDWASTVFGDGQIPEFEDGETVYLIEPVDDETHFKKIIKGIYKELFDLELEAWCTNEKQWPENRTFEVFNKWFKYKLHAVVEDLIDEPIENEDDFDGED